MVPETPAMSGPGARSPEDGKAGMHMSISDYPLLDSINIFVVDLDLFKNCERK